MSKLHSRIIEITNRIRERSFNSRNKYLRNIESMEENIDTNRGSISCSNMAHTAAAAPSSDKESILMDYKPNIGIVSL